MEADSDNKTGRPVISVYGLPASNTLTNNNQNEVYVSPAGFSTLGRYQRELFSFYIRVRDLGIRVTNSRVVTPQSICT